LTTPELVTDAQVGNEVDRRLAVDLFHESNHAVSGRYAHPDRGVSAM
jgi:hypothetical protein